MDEFIDDLLREDRANDVILPRIQKRYILEEANEIEPRVSLLEADDLDEDLEVNKIYLIRHITWLQKGVCIFPSTRLSQFLHKRYFFNFFA